jgi:7-cyano-7-deazaguanine reductase
VKIVFFDLNDEVRQPFPDFEKNNLNKLVPTEIQESIFFTQFKENPALLKSKNSDNMLEYRFFTDLLRSNCRVTNQPDWGDLFVRISTKQEIELGSVMEYLVSFRQENHFHEEVVEMIYKRFNDIFKPEKLMVAAMYTRRGGIDINPIRASHTELLDDILISTEVRVMKTLRQ